jgi:putative membrane protein
MIRDAINGFMMALADSVPGVSGSTVAFIMGFYDRFISAVDALSSQDRQRRKDGLAYLLRLGLGWILGMALAVLALNALFAEHIHVISSLFLGFIIGAVVVVAMEEKDSVRQWRKGLVWGIGGAVLVSVVTYLNTRSVGSAINLLDFNFVTAVRLFFTGVAAVCAMFLPGISGSMILLIFGAYVPVMTALKGLMTLNLAYLPGIVCFGCGVLTGAAFIAKALKVALQKYRPQMIWLVLGMMAASVYAVVMGPATLDPPQAPLAADNFSLIACGIGAALVLAMQKAKPAQETAK